MNPARPKVIYVSDHAAGEMDPLLKDLQRRYGDLPPISVRYHTREGQNFLSKLHQARQHGFTRHRLAATLHVTTQAIDKMLKQPRSRRKLRKWPHEDDMRELRAAWAKVRPRIPRSDPAFAAVHLALQELLINGFELPEVALALKPLGGVRKLERFVEEPFLDPAALALKIRKLRADS